MEDMSLHFPVEETGWTLTFFPYFFIFFLKYERQKFCQKAELLKIPTTQ